MSHRPVLARGSETWVLSKCDEAILGIFERKILRAICSVKISEEIAINQGARYGCSLSTDLFNTYTDRMLQTWKTITNPDS